MFHNDNMPSFSQRSKYKIYKTKNSKPCSKEHILKHSKNIRNSKSKKNKKHCKFKHINSESDFVGSERLTKQVGIFTKGKISNSISRFEKIMPREVRARVRQDLQEVLNINSKISANSKNRKPNNSTRSKYQKSNSSSIRNYQKYYSSKNLISDDGHTSPHSSSRNSCSLLQNSRYNSRFASNSWKDKVQQSVGIDTANSILASVQKPQKTSSVKELQLLARKVLLTKIYPVIKDANSLLYPNMSNRDKIKAKLQQIKSELNPCTVDNSQKHTSSASTTISSQISPYIDVSSSKKEEFHLNPIYTGEDFDQNGISKIFPNVNEFPTSINNFETETGSVNLSNKLYDFERIYSPISHPSIGQESAVNIVPISPTTSDDSPTWKLELSPVKFEPDLNASPRIYYRHKMF